MSAISDCFAAAKAFIVVPTRVRKYKHVRQKYICHAIDATDSAQDIKRKCKTTVSIRLGATVALEGWLRVHYGLCRDATFKLHPDIQQTRVNWLDSLIEEFK